MIDPATKNLGYDASGNLTQGYTPAGYAFTATYDGSNRLATLSFTDGAGVVNRTEYYYLGEKLIWKKNFRNGAANGETRYTWNGFQVVQERNGSNVVTNEYTYGLGLPGGIGGLLRLNQGGAAYSYLFDGKGNVTALLNGVGQAVQSYQYDPFGQRLSATGSLTQPMQFSTKPYDDQTGLSYYGFRFYSPNLGRWMTRDPLGEAGGINLYGFVGNNPGNYIDPDGKHPILIAALLAAGYGALSGATAGAIMGGIEGYLKCGCSQGAKGGAVGGAIAGGISGAIGGLFGGAAAIVGGAIVGGVTGNIVGGPLGEMFGPSSISHDPPTTPELWRDPRPYNVPYNERWC